MDKAGLINLYKNESANVFNDIPVEKIVNFVDMMFEAYENQRTVFSKSFHFVFF